MVLNFKVPSQCHRLQYIANQLFTRWYDIPCNFRVDPQMPPASYEITYNNNLIFSCSNSAVFFTLNHPRLPEWAPNDPEWAKHDWLGMAFYSLSRAEEYGTKAGADPHGRFVYKLSHLHACKMLQEPWIDRWVHEFVCKNNIHCSMPQYTCLPTLDIDMTHAILGRPWWRSIPAFAKSLVKGNAQSRYKVLTKKQPDPFDNFDYQLQILEQNRLQATYFFQTGPYGKYDKNIPPHHPLFVSKVQQVMPNHTVGIHPSYGSFLNNEKILSEIKALQQITGRDIRHSRQHFLRFTLPQSYRLLAQLGVKNDYSMGYAEIPGFRAGTGRAFVWFDLEHNKESSLTIHPFCVMDVAMQYFLQYSIEQALNQVSELKKQLRALNSTFSFCFHNESLSNIPAWRGWREVFELACKEPPTS